MSDTQVGGNGSVHWTVNADDVTPANQGLVKSQRKGGGNPNAWFQHGVDYRNNGGGYGPNFTVRILVPEGNPDAWLAMLRAAVPVNGILEFTLPIIKNRTVPEPQIQVCWGTIPPWYNGIPAPAASAASVSPAGGASASTGAGRTAGTAT
jgi:hypothetical protein